MATLLALEWDSNEVRAVLARKRGREAIIEDAFTVDLAPRDPGQTFAAPQVGARIAAELTARNIAKVETLVAVGRKDIELRLLNVPPAPPDELPDVVRFQAMRQFSQLGADWPLDYVPIVTGDEMPTSVLAATLTPETIKQIRATCEVGNLTPRRMVLRPIAAASLLSRELPDAQRRCRLMIDMLSDEADLTVLVGEQVVFLRTCRLPSDTQAQNTALVGEIRRTMVAAQNQLGGRRVEYVIICGNPLDHSELVERLGKELSLPIEAFDPFAALTLTDEARRRLPDRHGRFAPLLGMLLDEAAGTPHGIDFLNPRQRPAPPDRRRERLMIGGGIGAIALSAAAVLGFMFYSQSVQLAKLKRDIATAKGKPTEEAKIRIKEAQQIEKFIHGNIVVLDEMHRLSDQKHYPLADDVILTQLSGSAKDMVGGDILLEGQMRNPTVDTKVRQMLADDRHLVTPATVTPNPDGGSYISTFKQGLSVTHPEVKPIERVVRGSRGSASRGARGAGAAASQGGK